MQKTHIIIFHDGNTRLITGEQERQIWLSSSTGGQDGTWLDHDQPSRTWVRFSSIARICPVEEFYSQNPDKRPATQDRAYMSLPEPKMENYKAKKGLVAHWDEYVQKQIDKAGGFKNMPQEFQDLCKKLKMKYNLKYKID